MELDEAYANGAYIAKAESYPGMWQEAAENFAFVQGAADRFRPGLPYGSSGRARFDLVLPEGTPRGLMMFVHGGYWLKFDRSYWTHLAAGAQARGWAVALPSYDLCPEVRIARITEQISQVVQVCAAMIDGPIVLSGHSAGGHLVARMLEPGRLGADVENRLQKVVPISPLADLRPLLKTSMAAQLRLDEAEAVAESPVLMRDRLDVPVTVWVGGDERPAFLDQARWLAEAWGCEHIVAEGRHHFDVIEPLEIADSDLVEALVG